MGEQKVSETYVFASCQQWHRQLFETLEKQSPASWHWVSSPEALSAVLQQQAPRYIFFFHWNWIVSDDIWQAHECVCFHMTDVPYGRGGSPLQNLIVAGHTHTRLSALRMVKEMDAGPVYAKRDLELSGTAQEIYVRAGALSLDIVEWMIREHPAPLPQEGEIVTFKRRKPEQSRLPESGDIASLHDFIRMLDADGYPHAFIEHGDYRLEFTKSKQGDRSLCAEVTITLRIEKES